MERIFTYLTIGILLAAAQNARGGVGVPEEFPTSRFGWPAPVEDAQTNTLPESSRGPASASTQAGSPIAELPEGVRGVQEVSIIASDIGFFPKVIFVNRNIPVRLFVTSSSKNTLCIMMDSFGVTKQVNSSKIEELSFTPTVPGKYRFHCPVNGIEGELVVREGAVETPGVMDNRMPASAQ